MTDVERNTGCCSEPRRRAIFQNLKYIYMTLHAVILMTLLGLLISNKGQIARLETEMEVISQKLELVKVKFRSETSRTYKREVTPSIRELELKVQANSRGMKSVRLEGRNPHQTVTNEGHIGPWKQSRSSDLVRLIRNETELEINAGGLYFVYAQVYYVTRDKSNSYEMHRYRPQRGSQPALESQSVSTCASQANLTEEGQTNEVSCYTATTVTLQFGDRLYLNQVERNRHIDLSKGFSYFGLIQIAKTD